MRFANFAPHPGEEPQMVSVGVLWHREIISPLRSHVIAMHVAAKIRSEHEAACGIVIQWLAWLTAVEERRALNRSPNI